MITSIDEAVKIAPVKLDILKKFESRLEVLDKPPNPLVKIDTTCILCSGYSTPDGYKMFFAQNKRLGYKIKTKAHIAAYLLYVGPRDDQQVQHLCGVKYCANYDHLCLGDEQKNGQHASITRAKSDHSKKAWKLSEPDRHKIRQLHWLNGYPVSELADMYQVSKQTIYNII